MGCFLMIENILIVAIVAVILGGAIYYIIKEKKKGAKCIGCPYAKECASKKSNCNCNN